MFAVGRCILINWYDSVCFTDVRRAGDLCGVQRFKVDVSSDCSIVPIIRHSILAIACGE
jgi:hypothetical protein